MFTGYWLDDYNFLCPAVDKDKNNYWVLIKTVLPRDENGSISFDPISGKAFDMEIIDPDCFEWQGRKCKICMDAVS